MQPLTSEYLQPFKVELTPTHFIILAPSIAAKVQALHEECAHVKPRWFRKENVYATLLKSAQEAVYDAVREAGNELEAPYSLHNLITVFKKQSTQPLNDKTKAALVTTHAAINALLPKIQLPLLPHTLDTAEELEDFSSNRVTDILLALNKIVPHIPDYESIRYRKQLFQDQIFITILGANDYQKWLRLAA